MHQEEVAIAKVECGWLFLQEGFSFRTGAVFLRSFQRSEASITVTDIQPGFVDTAMAKAPNLFWVASPQKAAIQIYETIKKKKKHAYITKRWRLIAWALKLMPDFIYEKI